MSPPVDFDEVLTEHGLGSLRRASTVTLQVNVGKRCNQACHHCHVDAGPKRTEIMTDATAARVIELLARNPQLGVLDVTGGAPELAGCFRELVTRRAPARAARDRSPQSHRAVRGRAGGPGALPGRATGRGGGEPAVLRRGERRRAARRRRLREEHRRAADAERARLRASRVAAAPRPGLQPGRRLPAAASRTQLEADYRERLGERFGITFHHLLTITNMPISRFAAQLARDRRGGALHGPAGEPLQSRHRARADVPRARQRGMGRPRCTTATSTRCWSCRSARRAPPPSGTSTISRRSTEPPSRPVAHCFGCTAGAGSSCGGTIA